MSQQERVVATVKRRPRKGYRVGARLPRMTPPQQTAPFHLVPAGSEQTACGLDAADFADDISGRRWDELLNSNKCQGCREAV